MSEYIVDVRESERDGEPFNYLIWKDELIRCRDCKFYHPEISGCEKLFGVFFDAHGGDFCSYAEPKEGEE